MSIYIKEYLSVLIITGIVKVFFCSKKLDGTLKLISFFAMMSMIIIPLTNSVIQGDFIGLVRSFKSDGTVQKQEYYDYFANAVAYDAVSEKIRLTENAFKAECTLRGIKVYDCKASISDNFSIEISADSILDETVVNRLKDKYNLDKVLIRLVN